MKTFITNNPESLTAIILAVFSVMLVLIYINGFYKKLESFKFSITSVSLVRLMGFFLLGIIPAILAYLLNPQLIISIFHYPHLKLISYFIVPVCTIIIFTNYKITQKQSHYKNYPEIKIANWKTKHHVINALFWMIYLFGYELLFRGILLYSFLFAWDANVAIFISVLIYALAHIHKGRFETIGSVPLGILFCIITFWTQSFITVFILHCTIAISNDIFCIRVKLKKQSLNHFKITP